MTGTTGRAAPTPLTALTPAAVVLGVALAVTALWVWGPGPAEALHALTALGPASASTAGQNPTGPIVATSALLAWACVGWLALISLLSLGAALPGATGRSAAAVTRACAPWALRRFLAGALGISTLLVAPNAAFADSTPSQLGPAAPISTGLTLDWPGIGPTPAGPSTAGPTKAGPATSGPATVRPAPVGPATAGPTTLPRAANPPATPRPSAPPAPSATPLAQPAAPSSPAADPGTASGPGSRAVVVRPGDSLWTVAARSLGASATPKDVATAWPSWWAANREAIGPDPNLIHPGDRLVPPAS